MEPGVRSLRRIGLLSLLCWAGFAAAALRLAAAERTAEGNLRLALAAIGVAATIFVVLRAGAWPRVLYVLATMYAGYFVAASGWHDLWRIATVPADSGSETVALTLELAGRTIAKQIGAGATGLALSQIYELALMPLTQLMFLVHLVRSLLQKG